MSCSYGPGRYDINYEEKGLDYPAAYVRWTENRNMHAFQQAIHSGRVDMDYLSTHVFPLDQAPEAYNLILGRNEPFLGILIEYHAEQVRLEKKIATGQRSGQGKVNVAFAGAGSYALSHLLPNIPKTPEVCFKGVMTSSGASSRTVADKFKFEFCTADAKDIFENDDINTVFIATRHNTHAPYLLSALHNGKNVFVEKPLCLKEGEFSELTSAYYSANPHPLVMIGFNRRFAPLVTLLKQKIGDGPMSMLYRINAGTIPPDSWIQDREIGGGRILGEVCHFVDLLTFVNGSLPTQVFASALPDAANLSDTISVTLVFANGSVGSLCYFSNGPKSLEKEYLEIYRAGTTAILRDFKSLEVFGSGSTFSKKLLSQDKGQSQMVAAFIDAVRNGTAAPISFEEMCAVTSACFKIVQSLQTKSAVSL